MNILAKRTRFYIVGIKGVGMTALAQLLRARGHEVSGSDVRERFFTDEVLQQHGIPVREGFGAGNLPQGVDAVLYSTAYDLSHPELAEAQRRGIPLMTYPEMIGELLRISEGIAVAGSHGKTTTTALLGAIFAAAEKDPTVIVGSSIPQFGGNALIGASKILIVETDEYQNKFTHYRPRHLVLTNIDYDHPDFFSTPAMYVGAFQAFLERLPPDGILAINADDPITGELLGRMKRAKMSFGTRADADVRLVRNEWVEGREAIHIVVKGKEERFTLSMPGRHNALNACAAVAFAQAWGIDSQTIRAALAGFRGVRRRFEYVCTYKGAEFFDDYAHHPAEIAAAIAAARERFPQKKLIVVFQPHTYSRTKVLVKEFAASLVADELYLLEVYGSAREKTATVSSRDILARLPKEQRAHFTATLDDAVRALRPRLSKDDLVLLLGAGDVWRIASMIKKKNEA